MYRRVFLKILLPRVSRQLAYKSDDMIPGNVHRSPGIYLAAKENPVKPQLGNTVEGCVIRRRLKWGHLPRNDVGKIVEHVMEG